MAIEILLLKGIVVGIVAIFHFFQGRHIKGVLLAILIWLGIPSFDDLLLQPLFAQVTGLPMPISIIAYFGIIWLLVVLIWLFL